MDTIKKFFSSLYNVLIVGGLTVIGYYYFKSRIQSSELEKLNDENKLLEEQYNTLSTTHNKTKEANERIKKTRANTKFNPSEFDKSRMFDKD